MALRICALGSARSEPQALNLDTTPKPLKRPHALSPCRRPQANALDSEAATWHLLWHLYGVTDAEFPAGLGGPALDGVGGRRSAAQRIADTIAENDTLNRCALRRTLTSD